MTPLLNAIRADVRFRHELLYPQGSGPFGWLRCILFSRGMLILTVQRLSNRAAYHKSGGNPALGRLMGWTASIGYKIAIVVAKADVVSGTHIAPGVCLSDRGNIIIGAKEIGAQSIIHHRVTIGMALLSEGRPSIGERVWIGPDCVVYGAIDVGDGATLAPGSVVTKHVPPRTVMSGNPARAVARDFDNAALRSSLNFEIPVATAPWAAR